MQFDTRTVAVVSVFVALVPGTIGGLVWQTRRTYPGRWVLGNLLTALALFLLSMRGRIPDSLSIVVANAAALVAAIAFLQGIRRFRGLPIGWWQETLVGALALAAVTYFRYVTNNINARVLAVSLGMASIGFASGIMLLKDIPRDRRTAYILTGVVFTLAGVINLVRGIYVFALAPIAGLFDQTISNGLLFLVASMGVVSWSLGFIVLTADGLAEDTKEKPIGRFGSNGATKTGIQRVQRGTVSEEEVRQQLARIVDSNMFRRSTQMVRFLTIIVERSLSGRPEDLKEYVLGRDAFHRGEDYDPRTDSIVRVEAQRLRRKLREYYDSKDRRDTILIELPAGSYVPVFKYLQPRINDQLRLRASAD